MATQEVRFGAFDETAALEIPKHWRILLEGNTDFYNMLVYYPEYHAELDASPIAEQVIVELGYTLPPTPTGN